MQWLSQHCILAIMLTQACQHWPKLMTQPLQQQHPSAKFAAGQCPGVSDVSSCCSIAMLYLGWQGSVGGNADARG